MKNSPLEQGKVRAQPVRIEPRWPVALAVFVTVLLLVLLRSRARLFPPLLAYVVGMGLLLPMAGVWLSGAREWWLHLERASTLCCSVLVELITLATLWHLVRVMLDRPTAYSGRDLLTSSISGWVANVLAFALVYWQIDRGGPEARGNNAGLKPDWHFQQSSDSADAPPGWRPTFIDYLFLSFSTATAFSTTDTTPLTPRAKMLMMIESSVSLATLVIVASRAINTLGT